MFLASNIKVCRKDLNYSQSKLAELVNVSQSTISKFESGQVRPNDDQIQLLACVFKQTVEQLTTIDMTQKDQGITLQEIMKAKQKINQCSSEELAAMLTIDELYMHKVLNENSIDPGNMLSFITIMMDAREDIKTHEILIRRHEEMVKESGKAKSVSFESSSGGLPGVCILSGRRHVDFEYYNESLSYGKIAFQFLVNACYYYQKLLEGADEKMEKLLKGYFSRYSSVRTIQNRNKICCYIKRELKEAPKINLELVRHALRKLMK